MQASFVYCKPNPNEVLLVCRRDLIAQTVKRLSMFVLRARVKLTDATADFHLMGLAGNSLASLVTNISQEAGALTSPPEFSTTQQAWRCIPWESAKAHVLTLYPAMGQPRALMLASSTPDLSQYPALDPAHWQLGEVMSGIAWVELATFEAFVPQMLNYESVDGVNFKKGCYPGQEVVARSQFRGTLKRRAYVMQSAGAISAGQEIFTSDATDQPCGLVAQVATVSDQTYAVVELQTSVVDEYKLLHVGTTAGPQLHALPLPYVLKDYI
jgi:folate-binding protein YgfZ